MSSKSLLLSSTAVVFAALAFTAGSASAQTVVVAAAAAAAAAAPSASGGPALEQIVVTARKREESLLSVPVTVAVVSAAAIEAADIKNLTELSSFTPGLYSVPIGNGTVNRGQYHLVFRGLSTSQGLVFIDGAPYGGSGEPMVTDVARIEVMEGPQSVYFGRSTFSGAVNFVTKDPTNYFKGSVSEDAYSYGGSDTRASVEGPLIKDVLTARVALRSYAFAGQYRDGVVPSLRLGNQSTRSGSLALTFTPNKNFRASGFYSWTKDEDGAGDGVTIRAGGPGILFNCNLGGTGGGYWCGELPKGGQYPLVSIGDHNRMDTFTNNEIVNDARHTPLPFSSHWLDHFGLKRVVNHAHLNASYTADSGWDLSAQLALDSTKFVQIRSVLGLDTENVVNPLRPTGAALATACAAPAGSAANQPCFTPPTVQLTVMLMNQIYDGSGELRLSSPQDKRLRATAGASYYSLWGPAAGSIGVLTTGRFNSGGGGARSRVMTPALFGGVYFDVTDKLTLNAEARYQWDGITQHQGFPSFGPEFHTVYTSFSPRLTANYKISPDNMVFATWSRGYKPGGFNPQLYNQPASVLAQLPGINLAYDQEKLDNFEIGEKGQWFDRRLRTTLTLYYMNWNNGQVSQSSFVVLPNGANGSIAAVATTGKVNLKGLEFEGDFAATRHLTISGTFDYSDNKIISYVYTPTGLKIRNSTNVSGNTLLWAPKVTFSLSPTYKAELGNGWNWSARLDYLYLGKIYVDHTNSAWIGASQRVNAHLGFAAPKHFNVDFYVKNLFDQDTPQEAGVSSDFAFSPSGACPPCYTAAAPPIENGAQSVLNAIFVGLPIKRTFGVRATYDF
jgi:iron complex outermembrane receptor protein